MVSIVPAPSAVSGNVVSADDTDWTPVTRSVPATLAEPTARLDSLTGLRWWAAFLVFLYHMRVFAPLPGPITKLFDEGYLGVTFFFVLSGFVLTWSMRPGVSTSTFYWRRFARIWPAHMVALLFAIPVFYTFAAIPEGSFLKPFDLGVLLLSVVVLQGWWANPAILFSGNPAAWTLTVEALFYALHPWISRLLTPLAKRGALLLALAAIAWAFAFRLGVVLWPESWLALVPMPITRVPEFLLGMALAWAMRSGWRPTLHPLLGISALGVVVIGIVLAPLSPTLMRFAVFGNEFFTVAVGLAIVALAAHALRGRASLFEAKWQVKLGEWSFAFYLIHATVIYLALRIIGYQEASWRNLAWFAVVLAIDIVLAWALHSWVERPVERRMRRWKDARDQRTLSAA
ncbi:peptidoglycan/LPS O-acetylase OafA/YrhL [Leucobacter luti]|uniref:acyltransferase family protein n=1 Tax=Leucobacter luti TaxID=340320 RepID=UPI001048973A|nr:acyltransferase [Leucobacter luti]MCW2289863.1 peptidoglycan/LPS O-acetylase OafA/YrhL [Leucobacter luti]TCK36032.1 peptidoglycan/LPS O-acetylase OafA/YrhL [Leucobacter luti]